MEDLIDYDPNRDFIWLLLRPWIWIPRLATIIFTLLFLTISLVLQGGKKDKVVQNNLAKRLLKTLTNLGPCFIKVGQALSTRPDLVRRDWLEELTKLQDNLPAFDHSIALSIIKEELGQDASDIFDEFPDKPVAAASLGQVYKARLKGKYWVAVKVQRPGLPKLIRKDLVIIKSISVLVSPILPLNLGIGLGKIIDEFGRSLFEEINYEMEADNAEKFAKLFKNNTTITIPSVERLLTSRRVITTSWIEGIKLDDKISLQNKNLDIQSLIRTGVISGIQQLLEFGYFHADPHPGNMFALKEKTGELGHIAYVDFGMMDSISDHDRLTLTEAVVHLINQNFKELAEDFQKLGFLSKEKDLEPIIPALKEVLGGSLGEEVGSFNFKEITDRFSELMYKYPFQVPARFALIIRAVVSQEGLALKLDSGFKIIAVAYPYVAKRLLTDDTKEMLKLLLEVIFDKNGNINLDSVQNLLDVLSKDSDNSSSELIPIAGASLKLLISKNGVELRRNLLMTLIKDEKINTEDLKNLIILVRRKFGLMNITESLFNKINPITI